MFSTLGVWKSLKLSPPNSVMLSFYSRLSNWRVDKGLLGSQGLHIHGVQLWTRNSGSLASLGIAVASCDH